MIESDRQEVQRIRERVRFDPVGVQQEAHDLWSMALDAAALSDGAGVASEGSGLLGLPDEHPAGRDASAPSGARLPPPNARWKSKASRTRRGFPIHAYIGANGHGKSLAMLHDTYLSILKGRRILSTVRIIDPRTGETYDNYERLTELHQLVGVRDADVDLDEIVGALPSTPGQSLPLELQLLLNQLRRRNVSLRWTAPSWMRCNVVLREVTQAVTVCRGYFPKYEHDEHAERVWGQNRLFRWTTYDAYEFTEWSDNKEAQLKGKANAWAWRGPKMMAQYCYDTFDAVDNIDSGEGFCFRCSGMRPKKQRPACTCTDHG